MKKKARKIKYEEPVDDATELEVEEEFRFNPVRAERLPRGVRKVRVDIYLDDDVVAYFKARAAQPDAAPYQAQINRTLREAMKRARAADAGAQPANEAQMREALLADEQFIKAVAEQVAQINRTPKGKRQKVA